MSENLFKNSSCPIQPVPQVDFDFITVDVCAPIPIPPPIFGCMTPVVPREPDTEVGVKCPVFGPLGVSVNAGYCVTDDAGGTAVIVKTSTDPCEYELALNINVPIPKPPCPIVGDTALTVTSGFSDCLTDTNNSFAITSVVVPGDCNTADQCLFDFALNIAIPIPRTPCPNISISTFDVVSGFSDSDCLTGAGNRFNITSTIAPGTCNTADQCNFAFDLAIAVPIPRTPCPAINLVDFRVVSGFDDCVDGDTYFRITPTVTRGDCNTADRCDFDIDVAIAIPFPRVPCPVVRLIDFKVDYGYDDCVDGDTYFRITPTVIPGDCRTPDECVFDFDVSIAIPFPRVPCPTINVIDFKTTTGYNDCTRGDTYFTVTPTVIPGTCNSPDQCSFDIDVAIDFPFPRPPCPVIQIGEFSATTGFRTTNVDGLSCGSNTYFRVTPVVIPGDCETPDQCNFLVDLVIDLPIPRTPCPTLRVDTFEVRSRLSSTNIENATCDFESAFSVTPIITPGDCNTPDQCDFAIDLVIDVPIPRTPCPTISVNEFTVATKFAGSAVEDANCEIVNKFEVTPTVIPGDCDTPDQCEFALDLALEIPIPRTPCPNISISSFSVASQFATAGADNETCLTGENSFSVTPVITPGDCDTPDQCDFTIDLAIAIPIPRTPCPTITIGSFLVQSGFIVDEESPGATGVTGPTGATGLTASCAIDNKFEITPVITPGDCNTPDQCEFTLDLELFIPTPSPPCPTIHVDRVEIVTDYADCLTDENTFTITATETPPTCTTPRTCDYAIDLALYIPVPKPECPIIRAGRVNVYTGYIDCEDVTSNVSRLVVTKDHTTEDCAAPVCDFKIDLDIVVPIPKPECPQIFTSSSFSGVTGLFSVTKSIVEAQCDTGVNDAAKCAYLFDLRIKVPPPPCPELTPKPGSLVAGYYEQNKIELLVTAFPQDPETDICRFELQPTASIQIPIPPCTIWAGGITVVQGAPDSAPSAYIADASYYSPGEECVIAPQIVLTLPAPCVPQFVTAPGVVYMVSPSVGGSAEIYIERIGYTCLYRVYPYLKIPKYFAPCATFDTSKSKIYTNGDPSKTVQYLFDIRQVSQDPDTGKCTYAATLTIDIPYCKYELKPDPSPKPNVKWGSYADPNTTPPTLTFKIQPQTESINNCIYYLIPTLVIPKAWPQEGTVKVGTTLGAEDLGYGTVSIDSSNKLKIDIMLYTTDCPTKTTSAFTARPTAAMTAANNEAETAGISLADAHEPRMRVDEIQSAILSGLQKDVRGNPVNPVFYGAMRETIADMLGLNN
jgi:hypothetical protein